MHLLLLLLAPALAGDPPVSGRWTIAETPAAVEATQAAALQRALDHLPFAFRPFARGRLETAVVNCHTVNVNLDASSFAAHCEGERSVTRPRAEPEGEWVDGDGQHYRVELSVDERAAALKFTGDEGGQRIEYRVDPDGSLVVTKEIFSRFLSAPVPWSVRYRRAD